MLVACASGIGRNPSVPCAAPVLLTAAVDCMAWMDCRNSSLSALASRAICSLARRESSDISLSFASEGLSTYLERYRVRLPESQSFYASRGFLESLCHFHLRTAGVNVSLAVCLWEPLARCPLRLMSLYPWENCWWVVPSGSHSCAYI